jgi:hypothetical protein
MANGSLVFNGSRNFENPCFVTCPDTFLVTTSGSTFTVEAWLKMVNPSNLCTYTVLFAGPFPNGSTHSLTIVILQDGTIELQIFNEVEIIKTDVGVFPINSAVWTHLAVTRDESDFYTLYVDGVSKPNTYGGSINPCSIQLTGQNTLGETGYSIGDKLYFNGYVSNFRVSHSLVYTGASFTVPTAPLSVLATTEVLLKTVFATPYFESVSSQTSTYIDTVASADTPFAVDPACFNAGTKILCLNKEFEDEYVAVENLRPGDFVKTYIEGYRKIMLIGSGTFVNNPFRYESCMYTLPKQGKMTDDLVVTGCHRVLVDKQYVTDERTEPIYDKVFILAGGSSRFKMVEDTRSFTFYHFCLENDGYKSRTFAVWANGMLAETTHETQFEEKDKFNSIMAKR